MLAALGIGTGVGGGIDWFGAKANEQRIADKDEQIVKLEDTAKLCWRKFGEYREEHP